MVLYKRKQVTFVHPPQLPQDLSTEVYIIPETREWFLEYEEYLQRLDYYKHRKFVCEITGNSCLTFFEALESEIKEIQGVERDFPEALREHILRFLQFNRITRLDQLVDKVYSVFKGDYFPGETIYIKGSISSATVGQTKQKGTVREKVQYNNPEDGTSSTKYLVVRLNDMRQAIVTGDKISRDRNHFTKWLIKTFIKLTMTRSHKVGAPWVVKDKYAKKYRIPQEYPEDLKHFESFTPSGEVTWEGEKKRQRRGKAGNKNNELTKENADGAAANGNDTKEESGTVPAKKGRRKKKTEEAEGTDVKKGKRKRKEDKKKDAITETEAKVGTPPVVPKKKVLSFPVHYVPDNLLKKEIIPPVTSGVNSGTPVAADTTTSGSVPISTLQPTQKTIIDDLELKFDLQRSRPLPLQYTPPDNSNYWDNDDDDDEEEEDDDQEDDAGAHEPLPIQKALECWAFLNIYHKVLNLDTFTFDDFMYAIGWNYDQFEEIGRCELLDEMFCAVLGVIVSNETPKKGTRNEDDDEETIPGLLITLPPKKLVGSAKVKDTDEMDEERGSDTENENENGVNSDKSETDSDSEDEPESKEPKKLKTKRGDKKVEEAEEAEDADADEEDEGDGDDEAAEDEDENAEGGEDGDNDFHEHNAYLVMNYRNIPWYERLRKRNFKDGNWQCIMMGVFSIVEYVPAFKPVIDKVFKLLAPTDDESSTRNGGVVNPSGVLRQFYEELNTNLRIQCLNILISLLSGGKVVRGYIDDCLDVSTSLRRDRLDNIRDYKVQLELVSQYHTQIQAKLEEFIKKNEPIKEEIEEKEKEIADDTIEADGKKAKGKKKAGDEKNEKDSTPATAPDSKDSRSRSKISLSAEMTPQEEELASTDKEFSSLWEKKRIELTKISELKKAKKEIELKLVEMDCQRVKLLGKDRFGNRYWWFENNGLPTLHGSSNGDEDEDNSGANAAGVNGTTATDDMDDDEDELLDETYLMGKLWIQGPSQEDVSELLHLDDTQIVNLHDILDKKLPTGNGKEDINRYIKSEIEEKGWYDEVRKDYKEMDFASTVPKYYRRGVEKLYGITYLKKQIVKQNTDEIIVDHFGSLPPKSNWQSLTPMQRKLIEEASDPLISSSDWRYYDKREDIEKLLQWINPWGSRESQLRKELLVVKDAICQSMDGRRKALWLDKIPDNESEIEKQLEEVTEKIKQKVSNTQTEPEIEASDVPSDTSENSVEILPRGKRRAAAMAAVSSMSTSKRQRKDTSHGPPDTIANGTVEELRKLQEDLREKLSEKKKEKELSRILEWVNLGAREAFDKSLYEGGDKQKTKKRKK